MRVYLPESDAFIRVPDCWTAWIAGGVRFRRTPDGAIEQWRCDRWMQAFMTRADANDTDETTEIARHVV